MDEFGFAAVSSARTRVVRDFAGSELFDRTFQEGMDLVEETAAYLDGSGRHDSRQLSRAAALAYADISMRLTTRLMQVASWLLVQRAVREGDMTPAEACEARYRLKSLDRSEPSASLDEPPPQALLQLTERAERVYERVMHLDRQMYLEAPAEDAPNPVLSQFERLRAAFSGAVA